MNILLISQCTGKALNQTRKILDQFAERRGERVWQTAITLQGLDTLKKVLKSSARKNTSVACHYTHGKNCTELIWIVGNRKRFNKQGAIPTNKTAGDILKMKDENDWHTLQIIKLTTTIVALFHDLGKSNEFFVLKLQKAVKNQKGSIVADPYRHEWISLKIWQSFILFVAKENKTQTMIDDKLWIEKLISAEDKWFKNFYKYFKEKMNEINFLEEGEFEVMSPMAQTIAWAIVSHHRLPNSKDAKLKILMNPLTFLNYSWNGGSQDADKKDKKKCSDVKYENMPFSSVRWTEKVRSWASEAKKCRSLFEIDWSNDRYSRHLIRLSLMLADHLYSSRSSDPNYGDPNFRAHANTIKKEGKIEFNQRLDEHLIGVALQAKKIVSALPCLSDIFPRLNDHEIKAFRKRSNNPFFSWQDRAYELADSIREKTFEEGFFGINLASTGCGKTFANGKIMCALADPDKGARFSVALGLRTLTLQTGQSYRERLKLGDDDLAVLIGSSAVRELFDLSQENVTSPIISTPSGSEGHNDFVRSFSESLEPLMDEENYVDFNGEKESGLISQWFKDKADTQKMLSAPVLVSTIDYLIGATEATRGGKQIPPMLRLMTSDLVLDEPDDFGIDDLYALSRLVHWAGMLGSRVLLSSATLPPSLIEGLFNAYSEGRVFYEKARGLRKKSHNICCAWFDENKVMNKSCENAQIFMGFHNAFIDYRIDFLNKQDSRRKAIIKECRFNEIDESVQKNVKRDDVLRHLASSFNDWAHELHNEHHSVDPITKKKVSFGVIRFSNIRQLVGVTKKLFSQDSKDNYRMHLCCYHSQHPLLVRSKMEEKLDKWLNRNDPDAIFHDSDFRRIIDSSPENNIIFIVMGTSVVEVGRDHDYDWGIIEPSSMRAIIQLAGRIRRHRAGVCKIPNIYLLGTNIKKLLNPSADITYHKPGFENGAFKLASHYLKDLLTEDQYKETINSIPRIRVPSDEATKNLSALEHARTDAVMLGSQRDKEVPASDFWETQADLTNILQRKKPFRNDNGTIDNSYCLVPDEFEEKIEFHQMNEKEIVPDDSRFKRVHLETEGNITSWAHCDYLPALILLSEQLKRSSKDCAKKFGVVHFKTYANQKGEDIFYHPLLGVYKGTAE